MHLFEAILEFNQRKVAGSRDAGLAVANFASALPLAALTCIDARLNRLLPEMLGIPEDHFIWLRNAGNIITGPLSSTMRSLALACAVKGAKEVAVIGHTGCLVCKTTAMQLIERLTALGVDRHQLPQNLVEYFGLFGTERQNVIRGVDFVRTSPLIGPKVPVHGLLMDLQSGRLEWLVNGYQSLDTAVSGKAAELYKKASPSLDSFAKIGDFDAGELKHPEALIGEITTTAHDMLRKADEATALVESKLAAKAAEPPPLAAGTAAPPIQRSEVLRRLTKVLRPPPQKSDKK